MGSHDYCQTRTFSLMFIKKDNNTRVKLGYKSTLQDHGGLPVTGKNQRRHPDVDDIVHYVNGRIMESKG